MRLLRGDAGAAAGDSPGPGVNRAAAWRSWLASLLPALIVFVAARALAPPAPNGDGLGYLKASVSGADYPGHVGYVPLLRGLRRAFGAGPRAIDGLDIARGSSAACAACAVLLLGRLLRAPAARWSPAPASPHRMHASWRQRTWSRTHQRSRACSPRWSAPSSAPGAAVAAGRSRPRRRGRSRPHCTPSICCSASRCACCCRRATAGSRSHSAARRSQPRTHRRWSTAPAGSRPRATASATRCARTCRWPLYEGGEALVHAPYPYEASWCAVLAPTLVGSGVLACGIAIGRTERPRSLVLAWLVPYALIGLIYFPSEQERWLFVLPLFWLHAARARRVAMLAALVAIVLAADVCWLAPELRDSRLRDQAVRASRALQPGDLVVGPGHGWDEYVGFFAGPEVEPFPLVHHAAAGGSRAALRERLDLAVRAARARGGRVLLARLDDRADPRGWKELAAFDVTPENVRLVLPAGVWHDLGDGLAELIAAP
ncbi:MAG: hypothetical protein U1E76_27390 [Planctomycetota bacterium]